MTALTTRSPRITHVSWGRMEVDGIGTGKDFKLYPGGGRPWDWNETGTRHVPGIQPSDVAELLERESTVIVLSRGMYLVLQTCPRDPGPPPRAWHRCTRRGNAGRSGTLQSTRGVAGAWAGFFALALESCSAGCEWRREPLALYNRLAESQRDATESWSWLPSTGKLESNARKDSSGTQSAMWAQYTGAWYPGS